MEQRAAGERAGEQSTGLEIRHDIMTSQDKATVNHSSRGHFGALTKRETINNFARRQCIINHEYNGISVQAPNNRQFRWSTLNLIRGAEDNF